MAGTKNPIPKVCMHCGKPFVARKYVTKYCSLKCGQWAYKERERTAKLEKAGKEQKATLNQGGKNPLQINIHLRELIDIKMLAELTNISERTLFRLIQDPAFPKLKIKKLLRFHKAVTISYLNEKFAEYERDIKN